MSGEQVSGERLSGQDKSSQNPGKQGAGGAGKEPVKPAKETAAREPVAKDTARETRTSETGTRQRLGDAVKRLGLTRTPRVLLAQLWATLLHNLPLKLGALLLASIFWFFVSTGDTLVSQRTLRAPLHTEGLGETQRVHGLPERVTVRLSGPSSRLGALNPDGLEVVLNLRGVTGDFERSVRVFPPQGIAVVQVVPNELIGTVEARAQKEVPVQALTLAAPAPDTVLSLRTEPAAVQVEGAETQVARVTQVLAPYRPERPDAETAPLTVAVYAADAQGEPVTGVTLTPAQVRVSAAAKVVLSLRTLPLQLAPVRVPGRQVVSATLAQNDVTLVGPERTLAALSAVTATLPETPALSPGRYTLALTLELPDGVTARSLPQLELHVQ